MRYAVIGLFYWLAGVLIFGSPGELAAVPRRVRWRAHATACLATVLAWPLALLCDLASYRRRG